MASRIGDITGAYEAVAKEAAGLVAGELFAETSEPAAVAEPVAPAVDQTQLERYKKMFADARETTLEARRQAQIDSDYYHDKQWTSDELKVLRKRKQPEIWTNRIKPAVNGILGVLEQGQTDPRALPRTNDDMNASEIATDSLRYAAERSRWQRTKLASALDFMFYTAAVIVEVDEDNDPSPQHIPWEEFFYDPHSKRKDFSDARYMGIAKWMYVDQVKAAFGLTDDQIGIDVWASTTNRLGVDDEDKPDNAAVTVWGDRKRQRMLVVEMYHNDGGWKRCVFHGGAVLAAETSPYVDERGRPTNPIIAEAAYVDRNNQRYGPVRTMRPQQDSINMRESKLLHLVNSRQLRRNGEEPEQPVNTARTEAARPDGVIPAGYEPVQTVDMATGQAQLLANSKAEIERMGPNPAVLGRQGADQSGRAQLIRQQAGLIELTSLLGGIEDFELRVYRAMWCRERQYWTEPKWVRVTDDIGAPKFLQVNEPIVEQVAVAGPPEVVMGPDGMPAIRPSFQVQEQIVGYRNRPSEMDMDIIIDATPDTANLAQEQFAELVRLAGIYGPQEVPFDDLLEASSLPKKRALLEKRESRRKEQQGQGPDPLQAEAIQAKIENTRADTERKLASAFKDKTMGETKAAETRAEVMRQLTTFAPPQQQMLPAPQQIQRPDQGF